jgi:hypothetical protein
LPTPLPSARHSPRSDLLDRLTKELVEKETVDGPELYALFTEDAKVMSSPALAERRKEIEDAVAKMANMGAPTPAPTPAA